VNIENALVDLIASANKRKINNATEELKKTFEACFVRKGEKRKGPPAQPLHLGLLGSANDWKMLVDYDHRQYVFPPTICATSERPDVVIWSHRCRVVLLLELTVPAEEGVEAAQLRKEAKYARLLEDITASHFWKPKLLTLEVGARGLVATRTFRTFKSLGFATAEAKKLCKGLSEVAARCSYAIYLAHKSKTWIRSDLVNLGSTQPDPPSAAAVTKHPVVARAEAVESNITVLQRNEVTMLYHFTDAGNLESIREHGLLSATSVLSKSIKSTMNSDERSRSLDKEKGIEGFVRLSFNDENPMKHVALKNKRISRAVMLQIKLEVVSRPGVLFSNCNAARHDAVLSTLPSIEDFAAVTAKNQFAVAEAKRHLYQAEVLVPSPLPADLIVFPEEQKAKPSKARKPTTKPSAAPSAEVKTEGGDLPKPASPTQEIALLLETSSCTAACPTTVTTSSHTLEGGMASLVSCDRAGSLVGYEGGKLIPKFDPWMLLLFLRCLAEMCALDEISGFDPFRRLRMCKTHMLLKAFKLLPLDDRKTNKQRCEFVQTKALALRVAAEEGNAAPTSANSAAAARKLGQ
jgi:hypothetical protein